MILPLLNYHEFQIQDKFLSYDVNDIVQLINKHISRDAQDSIVSGVRYGLYDFFEGSNEFCDARCVSKTTKYFNNLFSATHDDETCPTIEFYCGDCQANAESFIAKLGAANAVPCCTLDALDSIVLVSTEYFIYDSCHNSKNFPVLLPKIFMNTMVATDKFGSYEQIIKCFN